ncbi:hypothetical protein NNJEOMEG_02680 [Fundidesulfovibrio magnetotacticus]|uniref:Uncharacterized protein n=2 Tax=Fundidesulfovibrio magnetotacticus TaxID=2730080 RepID=A0A6V8LQQ6_9BACT|nr:hypothetical protein NNJEOMEG_02680 [Fundidesulfovibrio magnetotacticus]
MVTGYRQNVSDHDSQTKKIFRKLFIKFISFLTGDNIPDPNSGLRIFKKSLVMEFINFLCGGFSFTTSLTVLAAEKPSFIKFIPIQYFNRKGKSKVQHFRDTLRTLQLIAQGVTYYNPIKFFVFLSALLIIFIAIPAMALAMFHMFTLSSYYMLFGCVVSLLLGIGVLGDIVRISATKSLAKK